MKYGDINEAAADLAARNMNGEAWSSPKESKEDKKGSYEHGLIDETSDGLRVWNDKEGVWYWV